MGKASTSKKVARAARAGGSPSARRRNWLFPASLLVIVILGVAVVYVAKTPSTASAGGPAVGDHWHNAYGVYVCDKWLDPIPTPTDDKLGIHTHGDGVIHIHPFQGGSAGSNATMQVFADTVGMKLGDKSFTMPDGTKYSDGYDCNGQPAKVAIYKWTDAIGANTGPTTYTSNFGGIRFTEEWSAFTFAVVPEGTTVPEPDLTRLKAIQGGAPEEPATTAPGTAGVTDSSTASTVATTSTSTPSTPSTAAP
jgi:hypothetical protein